MAKAIIELMDMSLKGQKYVLSKMSEKFSPIEIDGIIYMIPDEVNDFIKKIMESKDIIRTS
ncbi:MAG: hypothetical protein H8E55_50740 [Pelagibacterales bacterium]|nr:hypothetical protein [Pelagibacterales bacterium]